MSQSLPVPRVLSDATEILSNPDAYAHRPTLLHLARLALMSISLPAAMAPAQAASALTQRHRPAKRPTLSPPILRAIRGGLA